MKMKNDMAKTPSKQIACIGPTSAHSPSQNNPIRLAASVDWDRMGHIYNEAIHSGRSTMDLIPVNASYFRKLTDGFTPRECLLVAEHAPHIAAWGIVKQYSDRPGYALACETSVYVDEDYHGQGVGTALQSVVIQKAWGYGYRHLVAKILAVNETSVRFHHHFDYQIAGIQKKIGFLNGNWHDIVIMQRLLTDEQP
jgi:phosphinothricin acetyltransferase